VLGWVEHSSPVLGIVTIPEFFWELSLGIYLTVKGFKTAAVAPNAHDRRLLSVALLEPVANSEGEPLAIG